MSEFRLKRVYDPAAPEDGRRVLVERLWPRGMRKADAALDDWLWDIAPSRDLRRWYGHDPAKWPQFRRRYREELAIHTGLLAKLQADAGEGPVTLLFAAHDRQRNSAAVLKEVLDEGWGHGGRAPTQSQEPRQGAEQPRFRAMTESDLATILELESGCHPDPWTIDMLQTSLRQGHHCRVMELDGAVLGHAVLQVVAGDAELLDLCIGAGIRGQGWGRLFLRHLIREASEAGACHLFLEVRASNEAAIRVYSGEGFHQVGRRPRYYVLPDGREDALVMARYIGDGEQTL
ncbi:ribosomal protein S18-alanine N-acetyltransferase [Thiohalorhabdus sp.]|uniref:ribosomal protein S18-alanine N-acetyltransferase n=1 Tax=Thiohalorhabdus sp. TaxID=3094134 RepID=UPI002FC3592A